MATAFYWLCGFGRLRHFSEPQFYGHLHGNKKSYLEGVLEG